jgi:GPR endopeptidase
MANIFDLFKKIENPSASAPITHLVVGLGNSEITPDAIGPFSVRKLNVTRHLRGIDEKLYDTIGRCEISALFPGVLGQTGIETVELIRGAAENAHPDVVLVIDALAARSCDRLAATVQLSDSGINPGSGIGNHRKAICRETVGVPVIALGVPTVVNSATLVYDALHKAGIDGVFAGHCHANNTSVLWKGIRWTYGLKTGQYDYHTAGQLGGTLITLWEEDFTVVHVPSLDPMAKAPNPPRH